MKIIQSRLEGVPGSVVDPDALQFASRKVAAVSGDARRALDICRRAVEIAEGDHQEGAAMPPTPSKKSNQDKHAESDRQKIKVTISTIKQAINEATSSPVQQYLRSLPLTSKLLLGALLALLRRSGIGEITMGKVIDEAKRLGKMADNKAVSDYLLGRERYLDRRATKTAGSRYFLKAPRIIGMSAAAAEIAEAGIISLEMRKGERNGRVRLHVGEEEIRMALREDVASKGMGFSSLGS
jgi:origin recognition complex subunit 1